MCVALGITGGRRNRHSIELKDRFLAEEVRQAYTTGTRSCTAPGDRAVGADLPGMEAAGEDLGAGILVRRCGASIPVPAAKNHRRHVKCYLAWSIRRRPDVPAQPGNVHQQDLPVLAHHDRSVAHAEGTLAEPQDRKSSCAASWPAGQSRRTSGSSWKAPSPRAPWSPRCNGSRRNKDGQPRSGPPPMPWLPLPGRSPRPTSGYRPCGKSARATCPPAAALGPMPWDCRSRRSPAGRPGRPGRPGQGVLYAFVTRSLVLSVPGAVARR